MRLSRPVLSASLRAVMIAKSSRVLGLGGAPRPLVVPSVGPQRRWHHEEAAPTSGTPSRRTAAPHKVMATPPPPLRVVSAQQAAATLGAFIGVPDLQPAEPVAIPVEVLHSLLNQLQVDPELRDALFAHSAAITERYLGRDVYYRGLIEFSNVCVCDCSYCGIRKHQPQLQRYTMPIEEILEVADWAQENRYGSLMLQSGELRTPERMKYLTTAIQKIRERTVANDRQHGQGLGISLSVGELPEEDYQALYDAGAHRYLLRIESSNPELFRAMHPPSQTFENRLACLRSLKKIGYQVGTGVMIGLPGQTLRDLAQDLVFFREEGVDMIGMGPYIPAPGTPVAGMWKDAVDQSGREVKSIQMDLFELTTQMIALARVTMGNVNLAATTALQALNGSGRELALQRGANVLMPILTPTKYRSNYQLYEGKPCITDTATQCRSCLEMRVEVAGKSIAYGKWGDPKHHKEHLTLRQAPGGPRTATAPPVQPFVSQRRAYSTAAPKKAKKDSAATAAAIGSAAVPRINIGVFGLMNSGKSTLVNCITRQETSIVDSKPGTTADVKIALMEIHGLGPCKLFDTAGVDEEGTLGQKKLVKAQNVLKESDLALLVVDPARTPTAAQLATEESIVSLAHSRKVQLAVIYNCRKAQLANPTELNAKIAAMHAKYSAEAPAALLAMDLNAATSAEEIRTWLVKLLGQSSAVEPKPALPPRFLCREALIFLNIPMDAETPSGRLLRPQAQIQEQILRSFGTTIGYRMDLAAARSSDPAVREAERARFLNILKPLLTHPGPTLLVTDSQAMDIVHPWTLDKDGKPIVGITTFSIAMIQLQNNLELFVEGILAYKKLTNEGKVLIAEGCNHNLMTQNCDDISTGQLPRAIKKHAGPDVQIDHAFGREFPEMSPKRYDLAVHCGACMLDRQKQHARITDLKEANVPVTNYGLLLSYVQGPFALKRTLEPWGVTFDP